MKFNGALKLPVIAPTAEDWSMDQNERLARRLAAEKLTSTDLVLCRDIGLRDSQGWRFATRPVLSPDWGHRPGNGRAGLCISGGSETGQGVAAVLKPYPEKR